MAWYDGLFTSDSGLDDQDKAKLANSGLLQAGLGILAANGRPGTTPFQALAGGLLGGLGSVQQGTADIQNQRYKSAIEQSTLANMQASQLKAQQEAAQKKALHDALAANTDAQGNVDTVKAIQQYGKNYPEDAASALVALHGGKPELRDTPQGALQVYPDGYNAFLQAGGMPQGAPQASAMPSSIPAPSGAPGGGPAYTPPPPLLGAIKQVESGGNPNAVSPAGAIGTMQTLPSTLRDPGFGVTPARDNSPAELERVGNDYATALQNRYGLVGGLAAYNGGPGKWQNALTSNGGNVQAALSSMKPETQAYVPKVLSAAGQPVPGNLPQGANPSQLPPGRISLQMPSKTANADDEKYAKLISLGYSKDQAAAAAYNVKPAADNSDDNAKSWDDGLSGDEKNIVQGLANYQLPVSARFIQTPKNQRLIARAQMLNPDLNVPQYTAMQKQVADFASNSPTSAGGTVLSANTALAHLQRLSQTSDQLPDSWKPLNSLYNKFSSATSTGDNVAVKNWGTQTQLFAGELAKLVKGGVASEGEVSGILDKLNASDNKAARDAALQTAGEFLNDRVNALQNKRDQILGAQSPGTSLLTKDSQNTIRNLYKRAGINAPDLAPVGPALGFRPSRGDALKTSPQPQDNGWSIQMVSN